MLKTSIPPADIRPGQTVRIKTHKVHMGRLARVVRLDYGTGTEEAVLELTPPVPGIGQIYVATRKLMVVAPRVENIR